MTVLVPTGNPPSLRFGHPDVTFGRYRLFALGYCAGAAAFSGSALRVSHGCSPQRSEESAEHPCDGCPCVGAEEICGAPTLPIEGRNEDEHRPSSRIPMEKHAECLPNTAWGTKADPVSYCLPPPGA